MRVCVIQHVEFEGLGLIDSWIKKNKHQLLLHQIFNQTELPKVSSFDFLIILGGPMSANDPFQWLAEERQLIHDVLENNLPILGICLGAQQLAKVLGAEIIPSIKEVGWGEINFSDSFELARGKKYNVLHWHGEGFSLPIEAKLLAKSQFWANQAFQVGRSIGLQFHLETDLHALKSILGNDSSFIDGSILKQSKKDILEFNPSVENSQLLFKILDSLVEEMR